MKRLISLVLIAMLVPLSALHAQVVRQECMDSITVMFHSPRLNITSDSLTHVRMDGYSLAGELGAPALPVQSHWLTVPFCTGMDVAVRDAVYDTIPLTLPLAPRQPSRIKKDASIPYVPRNAESYGRQSTEPRPLFSVEHIGVARDRNLARLHFSPVRLDASGTHLVVCRSAEVTIRFVQADSLRTVDLMDRYHTPAFGGVQTMNHGLKKPRTAAPLRMTVLAAEQLKCQALEDFCQWKRSQGMLVDVIYVEKDLSPQSILAQVQTIYDNATVESPAPTYLLLVGDHEQLPAFESNLMAENYMHEYDYRCDDHVTDHYYTTFTDDPLPDCYRGRFSASDTNQLRNMIDKSLYYERYQFTDDNYLERAVLVAGVDSFGYKDTTDWAFRCADPTMDYIASQYVNSSNGYSTVSYYKNNSDYAPEGVTVTGSNRTPGIATTLRTLYNDGVGWVNYSAHGDKNEWTLPKFNNNDAVKMQNVGMPSFMIGNCCLSNSFNGTTCLGEALLRRGDRAGAVGYIGATNSTFWDEDFIWSVGYRNSIYNRMKPDYQPDYRGMYDHLFHTHGEEPVFQEVTAGGMMLSGIMSVYNEPGDDLWVRSMREYYLEIYQLMGDPSLLPWTGRADVLQQPVVQRKVQEGQVVVKAPAGAYVALVQQDSLQVVAATFAWTDGNAYLPLDDERYADCFLSITAQGYRPLQVPYADLTVGIDRPQPAEAVVAPNPATTECTVNAEGLQWVELLTATGVRVLRQQCHGDSVRLDLAGLRAGVYLLRAETATGTSVQKVVVR